IAADEVETTARKRANTPPATPVAPPVSELGTAALGPPSRRSAPAIPTTVLPQRSKLGPIGDTRVRCAAGVVIAILLGFVPATWIAASREQSALTAIDNKIIATQDAADTPEAYATLDRFRSEQLARKYTERRNIALLALLVWAVAGGAIAYLWFRQIPWDR